MANKGQYPPIKPVGAYTDGSTVSNSASALADGPTRALQVVAAGSLTVTFVGGTSVACAAVPVGVLPWCVTHVTAGTATVVALY